MNLFSKLKRYARESYFMGHYPYFLSVIITKKPVLAYYGFLGDGNLGDEMVYWGAKNLFDDCILVPIKRRMPVSFLIIEKIGLHQIFSGVVFGGGTLFGKELSNKKFLLQIIRNARASFVHGTGVRPDYDPVAWEEVFGYDCFGGLRGPSSVKALSKTKSMKVLGDAALILGKNRTSGTSQSDRMIIFNFGSHDEFPAQEAARNAVLSFLKEKNKAGYKILFLPFHSIDIEVARTLDVSFKFEILAIPESFLELQSTFDKCDFSVGERLHFIVSSILFRKPFFSMNYTEKHEDLLSSVSLAENGFTLESVTQEEILETFKQKGSIYSEDIDGLQQSYCKEQEKEKEGFLRYLEDSKN